MKLQGLSRKIILFFYAPTKDVKPALGENLVLVLFAVNIMFLYHILGWVDDIAITKIDPLLVGTRQTTLS